MIENSKMHAWLYEALFMGRGLRMGLGDSATEPGQFSTRGKRQTRFEAEFTARLYKMLPGHTILEIEGYEPQGPEDALWTISVDPTDGTAGDVRSAGVGVRDGLPVSAVIAIRRNKPNATFASVERAGLLNLRTGEIVIAGPRGAFVEDEFMARRPLPKAIQYNKHAPEVSCAMYRCNAFIRWLIPYGPAYPEQFSDSHASASVMLWALQGYCDAWFNFNLPGMTEAGQKGHELGAMAVFARALGSAAFAARSVDGQIQLSPLENEPYTFDGQTGVVLGPDEKIVSHYISLINESLAKEVVIETIARDKHLSGVKLPVWKVLSQLQLQVPTRLFSLPLIPE